LLPLPAAEDNAAMQADPPKAEPPKRKRRWFQFHVRTLMIGVTLLAVPMGYVGWHAKIVRERTRAFRLVHRFPPRPFLKWLQCRNRPRSNAAPIVVAL
jgi:hypothetical protein